MEFLRTQGFDHCFLGPLLRVTFAVSNLENNEAMILWNKEQACRRGYGLPKLSVSQLHYKNNDSSHRCVSTVALADQRSRVILILS
jgi:hypothetical protein